MGVSTDAKLVYGIELDEEQETPWKEYDDMDDWWLEEMGYKPPFEIYDKDRDVGYIGGVKPSKGKISEYHDHMFAFQIKNPLPVDVVSHCSNDYPMYIIAVIDTNKTASRGCPEEIKFPDDFSVDPRKETSAKKFASDYLGIENPEFKWILCSYWG